ncbi:MAG: sugar kinase [Rhodanobacter sp.]|nr:MAG: sugar kinase [Rhodanobacter sp.]TAM13685.1 MAG: sugar kinase [Rhodanobacter sp.]TAM35839.1 MAG: sugar kinase [Rhodanobacter sp.]
MLLRLSPPGQELLLQSGSLRAHFGGAEANVAASLAVLGDASAMVTTVPDNVIGRAAAAELRRFGVDTSAVGHAAGRMGLYFLTPAAMQRPAEVLYDRAGSAFAHTDGTGYDWPRLLEGAAWLHVSGINLALGKASADACLMAARAAVAHGVKVSFDCNYRSRLWGERVIEAATLMRELAATADLMFGNARDIALMLGREFADLANGDGFAPAATAAFAAWPRLHWLATTVHGGDPAAPTLAGVLAERGGGVWRTATRSLAGAVDRIGSGDAFAAALLHSLQHAADPAAALEFALAAAWLKHSVPGDVNRLGEADIRARLVDPGRQVLR